MIYLIFSKRLAKMDPRSNPIKLMSISYYLCYIFRNQWVWIPTMFWSWHRDMSWSE